MDFTSLRNELLYQVFRPYRYQWISDKMKVWFPWQLKNSKSLRLFWRYQLTALPVQPIWPIFAVNELDLQCFLASSSKTAAMILIFSFGFGDNCLFEVKNIEIRVPTLFKHSNLFVATVTSTTYTRMLNICKWIVYLNTSK